MAGIRYTVGGKAHTHTKRFKGTQALVCGRTGFARVHGALRSTNPRASPGGARGVVAMVGDRRRAAPSGATQEGRPYGGDWKGRLDPLPVSAWGLLAASLGAIALAHADPGRIVGLDGRHGRRAVRLGVVRDGLGNPAVVATRCRWLGRSGCATAEYDQRQAQ